MTLDRFERDGFAICEALLDEPRLLALEAALAVSIGDVSTIQRRGETYGMRNLLEVTAIRDFAGSEEVARVVGAILGAQAGAVRGIFFDKTPGANWNLRWHRDWAVPVRERVEVPGYGPWSVKAGVPHVYPPPAVLENMVTLRLHLDACDVSNGALKVIPGSHMRLDVHEEPLGDYARDAEVVVCAAQRGDAVLMRPLIAHSSDKSAAPSHRRVIHIEFVGGPLPGPLAWHTFVDIGFADHAGNG